MLSAVRVCQFDAAHRIVGHEGKCKNLHGHRFAVHFYAESIELDSLGRVVDFSKIKKILGDWIDLNWDHNIIIWREDSNLPWILKCEHDKKPFITNFNPTAENLAKYLFEVICPNLLKNENFFISKIVFFETDNCYVELIREQVDGNG